MFTTKILCVLLTTSAWSSSHTTYQADNEAQCRGQARGSMFFGYYTTAWLDYAATEAQFREKCGATGAACPPLYDGAR